MDTFEPTTLYSGQSKYQSIDIEQYGIMRTLKLDGVMQLNTVDQHRYHECLAVVPYLFTSFARKILILGGGDGFCARTLLQTYGDYIEKIVIIDIDLELVELCKTFFDHPDDPRVRYISADVIDAVTNSSTENYFDLAIMDLTDPTHRFASKAYTVEFIRHVRRALKPGGVFVTHCVSPFINPPAASCLATTVAAATEHPNVLLYRVDLPFTLAPAQTGFVVSSPRAMQLRVPDGLRFLNEAILGHLFTFANDELCPPADISTQDNMLYTQLFTNPYTQNVEYEEIVS